MSLVCARASYALRTTCSVEERSAVERNAWNSHHSCVYCSMHAASRPATVLRREQTVTRNTILSYVPFERATAFAAALRDTRAFVSTEYTKTFPSRQVQSNTFDSTRHADVSFFFYCVIETLATLLRADLIYYPCDCTKLLITELRQLRRTTYTFVHASYLSRIRLNGPVLFFFFLFFSNTFPSFRVIKEHVLSPATRLSPFCHELRKPIYMYNTT